jgi:hypothetical protein
MIMKILLSLMMMVVIFVGCNDAKSINSPEVSKVWIAKFYTGGRQCDLSHYYQPPDIVKVLGDAGVKVYDIKIDMYGVCAACGCPQYSARHYAQIDEPDLQKAIAIGFTQSDPL